MPREASQRLVAWSGAALGALLIVVGRLSAPAPGSNYAEVLIAQAGRIEAGMWVCAGIGVAIPAAVWLLSVAGRATGRRREHSKPAERAAADGAGDSGLPNGRVNEGRPGAEPGRSAPEGAAMILFASRPLKTYFTESPT